MAPAVLPAFSLIVPVYNGEHVLARCLQSVLAQRHAAYEVLLIDDGSTDGTPAVARAYCAADPRLRYHRQPNQGVSAARNQGLRLARHEHVVFVDADDYLNPDFLACFSRLLTTGALTRDTLLVQDYVAEVHRPSGPPECFNWGRFPAEEHRLAGAFQRLGSMNWFNWGVPFAKLYYLSVIREHALAFNEQVSFREDLMFMLDYLRHVRTLRFDPTANYHYLIDRTKPSLSSTTPSFASEELFFAYAKRLADRCTQEFDLDEPARKTLDRVAYTALFRCLNSCLYRARVPLPATSRISHLRRLATPENLRRLAQSGVLDTRAKRLAAALLRHRLYVVYDALNRARFRRA